MTEENEKKPEPKKEEITDKKPEDKDEGKEKENARAAGQSVAQLELAKLEKVKAEIEEANKKVDAGLDKLNEFNKAREAGGKGLAAPDKAKKLTDEEYAEALKRGEVNPLKEDGILK